MRKLFYSMLVAGALMFAATACERDDDELNPGGNPPEQEEPEDPGNTDPEDPTPAPEAVLSFYTTTVCEHQVSDWSKVEWKAVAAPDYVDLQWIDDENAYEGLLKVEWENTAAPAYTTEEWLGLSAVNAAAGEGVAVYALTTKGLDLHKGASGKVTFAYGEDKNAELTVAAGETPHTLAAFAAEGGIEDWLAGVEFSAAPLEKGAVITLQYDEYDDRYLNYFRLEGRNLEDVEVALATDPEESYWLDIMELGPEGNRYVGLFVDGATPVEKECTLKYTCEGGEELLTIKVVVPAVEIIHRSLEAHAAVLTEEKGEMKWATDENGFHVFEENAVPMISMFWDGTKYCYYVKFEYENLDDVEVKVSYKPEWLTISKSAEADVAYLEANVSPKTGADMEPIIFECDGEKLLTLYIGVDPLPQPYLTAYAAKGEASDKGGWSWSWPSDFTDPFPYAYDETEAITEVTLVNNGGSLEHHLKLVPENFTEQYNIKVKNELPAGIKVKSNQISQGTANGPVFLGYALDITANDSYDTSKDNEFEVVVVTDNDDEDVLLTLTVKTEAVVEVGVEAGYPKMTSFYYGNDAKLSNDGAYYIFNMNMPFEKNSLGDKVNPKELRVFMYTSTNVPTAAEATAAVQNYLAGGKVETVSEAFDDWGTGSFTYNYYNYDVEQYVTVVPVIIEEGADKKDIYYYGTVYSLGDLIASPKNDGSNHATPMPVFEKPSTGGDGELNHGDFEKGTFTDFTIDKSINQYFTFSDMANGKATLNVNAPDKAHAFVFSVRDSSETILWSPNRMLTAFRTAFAKWDDGIEEVAKAVNSADAILTASLVYSDTAQKSKEVSYVDGGGYGMGTFFVVVLVDSNKNLTTGGFYTIDYGKANFYNF